MSAHGLNMLHDLNKGGGDFSRRDFAKLTLAALAGLTAGGSVVAAQTPKNAVRDPMLSDPHICRGLNTCRAKDVTGHNQCAGTGTCATARYHPCKGHNDCRGQGGCGDAPGLNECRGWGACDVPLKPRVWEVARQRFEKVMKQQRRRFGVPPLVAKNG
jgi:hypothetical protein